MRLLLIRHAESQGNVEFRLQGRREFRLTQRGIDQAAALAVRLASARLAAVYSSPIRRALDTAVIVAGSSLLDPVADERLQEYDFGDALSGLTWREIAEREPGVLASLSSASADFPGYPGEEGRDAFRRRVHAAFDDVVGRHQGDETVAVVTHAAPIIALVMGLTGREYARPIPFRVDNASVTTVACDGAASPWSPPAVLIGLNDTCHLRPGARAAQPASQPIEGTTP